MTETEQLAPPGTELAKEEPAKEDAAQADGAKDDASKQMLEDTLVDGTVKSLGESEILFSLPGDVEGSLALKEMKGASLNPGDKLQVFVETIDAATHRYRLSKEKADRLGIWRRIEEAFDKQMIIEGEVIAPTEGGWSVDIGTKAFLPGSQLDVGPIRDIDRYLHKKLEFKIIRFNKGRANIVVSRRVLLEEERKKTIEKLAVGAVVEGSVQSFADYGAFIDLGGIVGLLHVTDMSWGRVNHPSEILELGQRVKVKVLKFDPEAQKVSLGIRQLQEDPWLDAERKYKAGNVVQGPVISITDYGMFLALEPGVEGLVHTTGHVPGADRARELAKKIGIGQELTAVVLELDTARKRISLGLKTPEQA
jgi:small subunit ribosomal protein S1